MDWSLFYLTGDDNYDHQPLWRYIKTNWIGDVQVIIQPKLRTCSKARWNAHQRAWKIVYQQELPTAFIIEDGVYPPLNITSRDWDIRFRKLKQRVDKVPSWKICALDSHYQDKIREYSHVNYGRLIDTKAYVIHWTGAEEWHDHYLVDDMTHFWGREYHYYLTEPWFGSNNITLNTLTMWGILGLLVLLALLVYFLLDARPGYFKWKQLLYFDYVE